MANKSFIVCNKCGTIFPEDYMKNWGRKYGIGLGPEPVCEALDSKYEMDIAANKQDPLSAMFPVGVCKGSLTIQQLPAETETAVLAVDDPYMQKRAKIMRDIQRGNNHALNTYLTNAESLVK
jgi:hypothetical protein